MNHLYLNTLLKASHIFNSFMWSTSLSEFLISDLLSIIQSLFVQACSFKIDDVILLWCESKGKVVAVLNWVSTTPWRCMGEWIYRSTYSWPQNNLKVSGSFMPRPLYTWEDLPPYPLDGRIGWHQNWSGWHGEEKNLASTYRDLNFYPSCHPACS
jgi:hypothetical protein